MINGCPLPPGYAVVCLDALAKDRFSTLYLEIIMDEDRSMLGSNIGSMVPWWKRNIDLIATMADCSSGENVERTTNPKPSPALPPISEVGHQPHKIWKISASNKESATDRNGKNLHCPSEQTGTKQKLQWQFELGKPLAHPNVTLSPKMAALNDWYLSQKAVQFGAIY